jgi:hypothetical protein
MSAATRRAFLAGAAVLPAAAAVPAVGAAHPDAELLRLCARFPQLKADVEASFETDTDVEDRPAFAPYDAALTAILVAEPTTLDGVLARARVAKLEAVMPGGFELWGDWPAGLLAAATIDNLLRLHGGAA